MRKNLDINIEMIHQVMAYTWLYRELILCVPADFGSDISNSISSCDVIAHGYKMSIYDILHSSYAHNHTYFSHFMYIP